MGCGPSRVGPPGSFGDRGGHFRCDAGEHSRWWGVGMLLLLLLVAACSRLFGARRTVL